MFEVWAPRPKRVRLLCDGATHEMARDAEGWWRAEVLDELGLDGRMLTEDIDVSMRALGEGRRLAMDPRILSYELAPTDWGGWWKQRTRWAQGWHEVSTRHCSTLLLNRRLSLVQRRGVAFLLAWRAIHPFLATQLIPLVIAMAWATDRRVVWDLLFFIVAAIGVNGVPVLQAIAANRLAGIAGFAPATFHAIGSRVAAAEVGRGMQLSVTNVPGPQSPLYAAGARMEATFPVPPLPPHHLLAIGVTSYDGGVAYAVTATQGGTPIGDFQLVQAMIADQQTGVLAGRAMVREAARAYVTGEDRRIAPSAAKLYCSEMVGTVADLAVQVHGGSGYMRDVPVERIYRDVRLLRLYEGTSEIQRLIIGGGLVRAAKEAS